MHTRKDTGAVTLDHAVIVASDLEKMTDAFADLGMEPAYAGPLANDINHLSQVAFPDGSYIELLSVMEEGDESPWWDDHVQADGGPCAFALECADIEADAEGAGESAIPVEGPTRYGRERPDGTYFDYELAIVGEGGLATKYPFLISDHTPRSKRVSWPTDGLEDGELTGLAFVVVAVSDLESEIEAYREAYGLAEPTVESVDSWGSEVARFPESPIILASPVNDGWVTDRLETFGERPAAYLFGSDDVDASSDRFDLSSPTSLFDYDVQWIENDKLDAINTRLGVVSDA